MSTESTQLEHTMVTLIFSWRESTSTTMKPLVENMYPGLFWWIWNLEPWIQSDLDLLVRSSVQITLCLDRVELETTGQRVITQRELNSKTQFLMLYEEKLRVVTVSKDSNCVTLLEEELVLEWVRSWSAGSVRNTQTES